jgi:hypothetical protein
MYTFSICFLPSSSFSSLMHILPFDSKLSIHNTHHFSVLGWICERFFRRPSSLQSRSCIYASWTRYLQHSFTFFFLTYSLYLSSSHHNNKKKASCSCVKRTNIYSSLFRPLCRTRCARHNDLSRRTICTQILHNFDHYSGLLNSVFFFDGMGG